MLYRYERVHQLLKSFINCSKSYESLPQQICYQWVLYFIKNGFSTGQKEEVFETYLPTEFDKYLDPLYFNFVKMDMELTVLKWCTLNSVRIEESFVFLYKYSQYNHLPLFVKVLKIFKQNGSIKVIGKELKSKKFLNNCYTFEVEVEDKLVELNLMNLIFHQNLIFCSFNNINIVVKNFYVPDKLSKFYDFN